MEQLEQSADDNIRDKCYALLKDAGIDVENASDVDVEVLLRNSMNHSHRISEFKKNRFESLSDLVEACYGDDKYKKIITRIISKKEAGFKIMKDVHRSIKQNTIHEYMQAVKKGKRRSLGLENLFQNSQKVIEVPNAKKATPRTRAGFGQTGVKRISSSGFGASSNARGFKGSILIKPGW